MSLVNIEDGWFSGNIAEAICKAMRCSDCGCWEDPDNDEFPGCACGRMPSFEDIPRMLHSAHLGKPSPATTKLCEYFGVLPNEPFRFYNDEVAHDLGPLTQKYRISDSGEFQEWTASGENEGRWFNVSGPLGGFSDKRLSVYHMPKYSDHWKDIARGVRLIFPRAIQIKLEGHSNYTDDKISVRVSKCGTILTNITTIDTCGVIKEPGPTEWTFLEDILDEDLGGADLDRRQADNS